MVVDNIHNSCVPMKVETPPVKYQLRKSRTSPFVLEKKSICFKMDYTLLKLFNSKYYTFNTFKNVHVPVKQCCIYLIFCNSCVLNQPYSFHIKARVQSHLPSNTSLSLLTPRLMLIHMILMNPLTSALKQVWTCSRGGAVLGLGHIREVLQVQKGRFQHSCSSHL